MSNDFKNGKSLPYTMHSVYHPKYEERTKAYFAGDVHAQYKGVTIEYYREIEELVEGYFVDNEQNGLLTLKK